MTNQTDRDGADAGRGYVPFGFLAFLLALFVGQFSVPDGIHAAAHVIEIADAKSDVGRKADVGGAAGNDLWLPSGGQAERRVAKAKSGVAEGDVPGKALLPHAGPLVYPFDASASQRDCAEVQPLCREASASAFRSRAPPAASA